MADDDFHEWIALDDPRPLSGWERAISLRFLDYDFADKEIVRSQLEGPSPVKWCNRSRGVLRTTIAHQLAMSSGTTSSADRGPSIWAMDSALK